MSVLNRLSLSSRIVLIAGTILALVTVLLAAIVVQTKSRDHRASEARALDAAVEILADELDDAFDLLSHQTAAAGERSHVIRFPGQLAIPEAVIDRIARITDSRVTYFELNPATGEFERLMTSIRRPDGTRAVGTVLDPQGPAKPELLAGRVFTGVVDILGTPHLTIYEPVVDSGGRVVGALFAGVEQRQVAAVIRQFALLVAVPALVVLGLGLGALALFVRRAVRPVTGLVGVIGRLEQKDYAVEIPTSTAQDEIGALTRACIALRDQLQDGQRLAEREAQTVIERARESAVLERVVADLRAGLSRLSDGDLSTPIPSPADNPFPAEYEPLRERFNAVVTRFSEVIDQIRTIAAAVRSSADEITGSSRELSGRAETQAATLEQSAAALTELTQSVGATAELAARAREVSFGNRTGAERGAEIVRAAVEAMQGIERGSEQITRIIGVIEDIAFQTNLLALNAGVEAARAGDAGRGFAVVASEVRLLAQRASDSAREIKGLISDSTQRVSEGSALVRKTGDSLAEILGRANDAASVMSDIAMAAADQARGLAEVNTGVNQLDTVTQQNSTMAETNLTLARSLLARSDDLLQALAGLRVRQADGAAARPFPRAAQGAGPAAEVDPKIVAWAPVAAAAINGPRANRVMPNAWAEF